jgi:hypothetical protein
LNDERIDFEPVIGARRSTREESVVRRVMQTIGARSAPRRDLAGAIVALGPGAVAAAAALALVLRFALGASPTSPTRPPTIGMALGIPAAAERAIRASEPVTGWELLTAFHEGQ